MDPTKQVFLTNKAPPDPRPSRFFKTTMHPREPTGQVFSIDQAPPTPCLSRFSYRQITPLDPPKRLFPNGYTGLHDSYAAFFSNYAGFLLIGASFRTVLAWFLPLPSNTTKARGNPAGRFSDLPVPGPRRECFRAFYATGASTSSTTGSVSVFEEVRCLLR